MTDLDDPLPLLEVIRLRSVPIACVEDGIYYVDMAIKSFREVKRPRICLPFDSVCGRDIARELSGNCDGERSWAGG